MPARTGGIGHQAGLPEKQVLRQERCDAVGGFGALKAASARWTESMRERRRFPVSVRAAETDSGETRPTLRPS